MTPRDDGGGGIRDLRILYLSHRFPYPPSGGAKVRAYHTIMRLADHNTVTVAAPVRDAEELAAAETLAGQGLRVETALISRAGGLVRTLRSALTGQTASRGYFRAPRLVRRVRHLIAQGEFDLVMVHSSSVAPYVADLVGPTKVLDFVDMDSRKWLDYTRYTGFPIRLVYALEGRSLARIERRLAAQFDLNVVATAVEAESLQAIAGTVPHTVVPNGVDLSYFQPTQDAYDPKSVCFVGRMDYFPNVHAMCRFCAKAWPQVRRAVPSARLRIVGANPTARVRELARIAGVEVTGTVEDVRPYVHAAACTVAPLEIARGTQNKLLESMALGVPVVASPLAARGVDARAPDHLLQAADPTETAQRVVELMTDPQERARLASAGRAQVESRHDWARALDRFEHDVKATLPDHGRVH